ncbi:MAG TPA: class I adenylate-forming enzyme family protein [Acidimicrobiales bacterium]|nr:class I adenylate-forming enzyme family protein [Acidimicrobiales bacterium]
MATAFPDGIAWRNMADESAMTLGQWHARSNRLARGLGEHGVAQGDRIALVIGDHEPLEWLVSYMAIHKAGAVAVPLLSRLGGGELTRILLHAGAAVALSSDTDAIRDSVPQVFSTAGTGAESWSGLLSADASDLRSALGPDDVADIMYTSGTMGAPKGVVVRHGGLATVDRVPQHWLGLGFLSSSPFATTSGSLLVCGPLRGGLSGWFLPRFDPERWITAVEQDRPVAGFLVPAMVELLVASPRFAAADLSSLATVNVGSAPIARATLQRFGAGLGRAEVLCGYGMTEFGAVTAVPIGDGGRHLGSVGLPLPGVVVRIVDSAGTEQPAGEVGQIAIGGGRPPRSYLGDDAGSEQTWVGGWLLSGDLGYLDGDGHLWIVGRQKEMIIRGGHNVVPGEVEAALFDHGAVAEAAVAGIPHPVLGEDVAAWVVLREAAEPEALRAYLLERLADYKVPRRITVLDALPRNESGKVLKSQLVQGAEPRRAT